MNIKHFQTFKDEGTSHKSYKFHLINMNETHLLTCIQTSFTNRVKTLKLMFSQSLSLYIYFFFLVRNNVLKSVLRAFSIFLMMFHKYFVTQVNLNLFEFHTDKTTFEFPFM